jgi:hypothetical protein
MRIQSSPNYQKAVYELMVHLESQFIWVSFYSVCCVIFGKGGKDHLGIVYLLLGAPFLSQTVFKYIDKKSYHIQQ